MNEYYLQSYEEKQVNNWHCRQRARAACYATRKSAENSVLLGQKYERENK